MKTRLLTITLAAVLAVLGIVAVLAYVRQANERAINGLKAETVLVATGAIPAGTSLSEAQQEKLLGTEKVPDSSLSSGALQSVTARNARAVLSATVARGQVLFEDMLGAAGSVTSSGSFVIPANMVAVSVDMCADEAVADYIAPGSYVAVFDTTISSSAGETVERSCDTGHQALATNAMANPATANTVLVLPKAEVLAVGPDTGAQGTSSASSVSATTDPSASSSDGEVLVTLAVSQAEAEQVILLNEVGLPYMALLGSSYTPAFAPPVGLFQDQP